MNWTWTETGFETEIDAYPSASSAVHAVYAWSCDADLIQPVLHFHPHLRQNKKSVEEMDDHEEL